jgi:hypothetical protein
MRRAAAGIRGVDGAADCEEEDGVNRRLVLAGVVAFFDRTGTLVMTGLMSFPGGVVHAQFDSRSGRGG